MIPKPTNRNQAGTNAILAAEEAHTHALNNRPYPAQTWAAVADAWSRIACLFTTEILAATGGGAGMTDRALDEAIAEDVESDFADMSCSNIMCPQGPANHPYHNGGDIAAVQPILTEDEVEIIHALRNKTLRVVPHEHGHPEIDPIQPVLTEDEIETVMAIRGGMAKVIPTMLPAKPNPH